MPEVISFGEPLVILVPECPGPLRHVHGFRKSIGGAELNFAIALARLGVSTGWFGRVGADEFGAQALAALQAEGVDTSQARRTPNAATGVMFKEYRAGADPQVLYYRRHSAASQMSPDDIPPDYVAAAAHLHVTGITAALSPECRRAVHRAITLAREAGGTVSFDPNIRRPLMPPESLHSLLLPLVQQVDMLLLGVKEGELLFGVQGAEAVIAAAQAMGVQTVAVKAGSEGSLVADGRETLREPAFPVHRVVDTVGAGDGFDAGLVAGLRKGLGLRAATRLASIVGAYAVTVHGDYEGYPTWDEVRELL